MDTYIEDIKREADLYRAENDFVSINELQEQIIRFELKKYRGESNLNTHNDNIVIR